MQKNYGYSSNKYLDTKFLKGVPDNFAGKKLVRSAMQTFFDISGGNFKTPQNCQSALFFGLIKGAFFPPSHKAAAGQAVVTFPPPHKATAGQARQQPSNYPLQLFANDIFVTFEITSSEK